MAIAKRVGLFLVVNFLVIITLSIVMRVLGLEPYLQAQGINYQALLVFCLLWGMGGAFISLSISRWTAKKFMGVQVIDPDVQDGRLHQLVQIVHQHARSAGLPAMPEVGIYESPEPNAFATGPSKSKSLVAVSSGLLQRMDRDEVDGVLGHEVAHIANGDMVTLTLIQGVVNAFVMFLARAIAHVIVRSGNDREGFSFITYFLVTIVLEMIFMIFGSMVVAWFSRYREFRADAGGARIAGRDKMIAALRGLERTFDVRDPREVPESVQAFQISSHGRKWMRLFSSHPPLAERIARLERAV